MKNSRVLVFIPMYNCSRQITRVIRQLQDPDISELIDGVICVDNRSTDDTAESAIAALEQGPAIARWVLRNDANYGLGGSHKVAIAFARLHGYSHLVVLHGDDQGSIGDIAPHLVARTHHDIDFLMGARFMRGSRLKGYSPLRTAANIVFNIIFSIFSFRRLYDLGSGLNIFRISAFDDNFHLRFADDLTFNYYLILAVARKNLPLRFFPLTWREEDQVSNARLSRMGFQLLRILRKRLLRPAAFFRDEHRAVPREDYPSTILQAWMETPAPAAGGAIGERHP